MNETYPTPEHGWTCFHCGENFPGTMSGQRAAQLHFGKSIHDEPKCQISARAVRVMEAQLCSYREEDTDLHRELASLKSDHASALRREEEKGYARGIKDASNEPWLGNATNKQLLEELSTRIEVHGPGLNYRTVDEESKHLKLNTQ